jgi:two-component system KDP operon response regulator KdpE
MNRNLLLVDDEPPILRALTPALQSDGWTVFVAETAAEALDCAKANSLRVVLLDLGLPDADGKDIIGALRDSNPLAVIVLSARHQEAEKVAALDAGADDYVDKPFNINELRARIRAAERRLSEETRAVKRYTVGEISLDVASRYVALEDVEIRLSPKEFELLRELMAHAGQVVTHKRLLIAGWGNPRIDQQYLRGYIALLRQKLEEDPSEPRLIQSQPGVGYRLTL